MGTLGRPAARAPINTGDIPDGIVTNAKLADNAVDSAELVAGSIDTAHLGNLQVTAAKVAADVATQSELDAKDIPGITSTGSSATHLVTVAGNLAVNGSYTKLPSITTTARDALTAVVGMIIYNSTIGMLQQYNVQGWASIDSPPTVSSLNYPGDDTALDVVGEYNDATCDYNNDPTIAHDTNSNMKAGMSVSGTGIPVGATIASVTSTTAFELSASTTGGAVTNGTLTFNTQTLIITGTNFQTGVTVTIDGTAPSTVTKNSSTQITVTGTPAKTAGTKVDGLVVTNLSGLSGSINVDYSPLPGWSSPASGNILDTFILGSAITEIDLVGGAGTTSYALTNSLPPGLAMNTTTGNITGTITGTAATTYNFTVTTIDAQAQSSPRLFNIISKGVAPTGGTITTYSGFRVHTFLIGDTGDPFTVSVTTTIDILIVAGGGGGGGYFGGGGGAGGVRVILSYSIAASGTPYTITVGDGGTGGGWAPSTSGTDGGNSSVASIYSATGGGGGGAISTVGRTGGSGGGTGKDKNSTAAAGNAGSYSPVEGFAGGSQTSGSTSYQGASGGGGASEIGEAGTNPSSAYEHSGDGGDGISNYLRDGDTSGTTNGIHRFGGGGAGSRNFGNAGDGAVGGLGGGGTADNSTTASTINGAANSGGGGAGGTGVVDSSGDGGSGIVIIRYAV